MKQIRGYFDINSKEFVNTSSDVINFSNDKLSVALFGRIETSSGFNNTDEIIEIFENNKERFTEFVSGIYIVLFYDKADNKVYVFHDRATSSVAFYYTTVNGKVYFGTSLKSLLSDSKIERKLNNDVVEEFITNGFVYGKDTLVKNVYKLSPFKSLEISENGVTEKEAKYIVDEFSKGEALDKFNESLESAVRKCITAKEDVSLPLSGGYDSNFIASVVSSEKCDNVTVFSIGGKHGKNELPIVESNIKWYNNFNLKSALTKDDTLQNFPDIVWRLEGSVYEVGLFLQYELACLVKSNGKESLICGECADQVFNKYYFNGERTLPEKKSEPTYYEFSEYPYIFGTSVILKKNGILANSFGIETFYPFLDKSVLSVAKPLGEINGKDKRVHVANCTEHFKKEIIDSMSKVGGATDCHSLFNSKEEINSFFNKIENSDFYKENIEIIKKHSFCEKEKQVGMQKLKTDIRNMVFDILRISKESRQQGKYFYEETKLREYMCLAYLILFDELFISGKYDLNDANFDKTFNDIML